MHRIQPPISFVEMRIQIQILRHALPPVSILFATSANPSSHTSTKASTIADLLHDVNDLVPLESTDGGWDLEDYVVELASTTEGDIENYYECLHYQTLESVLREDDEVLVRCLGSEELRERRRGGRMQITSDGRHLIDGVVFGRKWIKPMADMGRPGITIPPRKRRRLLVNEEDSVLPQEEVQDILDENTDEDDDFVDGIDEDKENIRPGKSVKMRLTFNDDDDNDDDQDDTYDDDSQDGDSSIEDMEGDELQLLLNDAEELAATARPTETLERQLMTRSTLGKRKRVPSEEVARDNVFEGFSTPDTSPAKARQVQQMAEADLDAESASGSDSESQSGVTAALGTLQTANVLAADDSEEHSDDEDDTTSTTWSSETGDSEEDAMESIPLTTRKRSVSDTSESDSDDSEFDDETSSSGTSSDLSLESDSDESSSSISHVEELANEPNDSAQRDVQKFDIPAVHIEDDLESPETPVAGTKPSTTPPGAGQKKTKRNNNRVKKRRILKALKAQGVIDSNANFDDLEAYESGELEAARQNALAHVTMGEEAGSVQSDLHEDQQAKFLEQAESAITTIQDAELVDRSMPDVQNLLSQHVADNNIEMTTILPSELAVPGAAEQVVTEQQSPTPVARSTPDERSSRSRLDVAASRRLLLGSLGLRTPKSAAEEQALRDKLAAKGSKAENFAKKLEDMQYGQEAVADSALADESWKQKLIISAVDCDEGGRQLPPPPFPFEQRWWKKSGKPSGQNQLSHGDELDQQRADKAAPTAERGFATDISVVDERRESQASNNESRTLSFEKEEDGMPIPTEYAALAHLQPDQILPGAVIAYKELHLSLETSFQPEVSPYRVARIIAHESHDGIKVCLAVKDRNSTHRQDSEASEAAHNPFEVHTGQEDDAMDDGIRELNLSSIIDPKLVDASKIHVPDSNPPALGGDGHASPQQNKSATISESAPTGGPQSAHTRARVEVDQLEIDTPRRTEITTIIKEAGFDSAMDERLLPSSSVRSSVLPDSSQRSIDDDGAESVTSLNAEHAPATVPELKARANRNEWSSSPPCLADHDDSRMPVEAESGPSASLINTSSPPVSPQLTVEYPHMSQLDLDTSMPLYDSTKQSSSNQDAQRLPPPPNADLTFSVSEEQENVPAQDEEPNVMHDVDNRAPIESLESEVPQLSSQPRLDNADEEAAPVHPSPRTSSFLETPGYDGQESSYHSSEDDNDSDASNNSIDDSESGDSLPSLRMLTSSQKKKINSTKPLPKPKPVTTIKKKHEIVEASLSPPPVRRNARRKTRSASGEAGEDSDLSPPPIKQSQKSPPLRMSQVPVASQVVDLTLSSDPVSPGNSEVEYSSRTQALLSKLNDKKSVSAKAKQTNGVMKPRKAVSDPTGLGTRRFLTQKKSRSQI